MAERARLSLIPLHPTRAEAQVVRLSEPLSFWGGIDPATGQIIDRQHPQRGRSIRGACLLMPGLRGSTAAPGALLECVAAGTGPVAIISAQRDAMAGMLTALVSDFIGTRPLGIYALRKESGLVSIPDNVKAWLGDHSIEWDPQHPHSES